MRTSYCALLCIILTPLLAACSQSEFPRVDFPLVPGNYFQVYEDGLVQYVELAVVSKGKAIQMAKGTVEDKADLAKPIHDLRVLFENCGVMDFRDPFAAQAKPLGGKSATVTTTPYNYSTKCEISAMPAQFKVVWPSE